MEPGGPWFLIFTSPALLFFASWVCGKRSRVFDATSKGRTRRNNDVYVQL